jgi:hypothetical protein
MKKLARYFMGILVSVFVAAGLVASPVMAQDKAKDAKAAPAAKAAASQAAPHSYKGDPDVYKVIYEDKNFRVIESTRKAGVHDKPHSHPVPSVSYNLTDCTTKIYGADGKTTTNTSKAGTARATPLVTTSHSAENVGSADCRTIFVERK